PVLQNTRRLCLFRRLAMRMIALEKRSILSRIIGSRLGVITRAVANEPHEAYGPDGQRTAYHQESSDLGEKLDLVMQFAGTGPTIGAVKGTANAGKLVYNPVSKAWQSLKGLVFGHALGARPAIAAGPGAYRRPGSGHPGVVTRLRHATTWLRPVP